MKAVQIITLHFLKSQLLSISNQLKTKYPISWFSTAISYPLRWDSHPVTFKPALLLWKIEYRRMSIICLLQMDVLELSSSLRKSMIRKAWEPQGYFFLHRLLLYNHYISLLSPSMVNQSTFQADYLTNKKLISILPVELQIP